MQTTFPSSTLHLWHGGEISFSRMLSLHGPCSIIGQLNADSQKKGFVGSIFYDIRMMLAEYGSISFKVI